MNRELIQSFEDACFAQYSAELELHEALEEAAIEIADEICDDATGLIRYADDMMDIAVGEDFLSEALLRYLVTGDEQLKRDIFARIHARLMNDESVQERARVRVCGK